MAPKTHFWRTGSSSNPARESYCQNGEAPLEELLGRRTLSFTQLVHGLKELSDLVPTRSAWGRQPFCLAAVHRQRDPKRRAVQTTIHYDSAWRDGP